MSLYVVGIPSKDDTFEHIADDVSLCEDDVVLCLGDTMLSDGGDIPQRRLDALSRIGCDVGIMRGAHERRYWKSILDADYGDDPSLSLWHGDWTIVLGDQPNIHYLPDAGGIFEFDGNVTVVLPTALIGPDYPFFGAYPMIDFAVADRMWALTREMLVVRPALVVSTAGPRPSMEDPDSDFMAELGESDLIVDVEWFHGLPADGEVTTGISCPGDTLTRCV